MYCIKNAEGLFFNGMNFNNVKVEEVWSENQMMLFPNIDMALEWVEHMSDFIDISFIDISIRPVFVR